MNRTWISWCALGLALFVVGCRRDRRVPACAEVLRATEVGALDGAFLELGRPRSFQHDQALTLVNDVEGRVEVRHFDPATNRWTAHRVENRSLGRFFVVKIERAGRWLMIRGDGSTALFDLAKGARRDVDGAIGWYAAHLLSVGYELPLPDWVHEIDAPAPRRTVELLGPFVDPYESAGYVSNGHDALAVGGVQPHTSYDWIGTPESKRTISAYAALYDRATNAWRRLPDAPFVVGNPILFTFPDRQFVLFDSSARRGAILDARTSRWTNITVPPTSSVTSIEHAGQGRLFAYGPGPRGGIRIETYDASRDVWSHSDHQSGPSMQYLIPLASGGHVLLFDGLSLPDAKDALVINVHNGHSCRPNIQNDAKVSGPATTIARHARGFYLVGQRMVKVDWVEPN